jgi:hypothetical protein
MPREAAPKNGDHVEIVKTRIKRPCTTKMQRLVKRRREPHEIPSKPYAIYNYCRECRGWEGDGRGLSAEVLACPNAGCDFWSVRHKEALHDAIEKKVDPYPMSKPLYRHGSDYLGKNARGLRIRNFCADCQGVSPGESRDPIKNCTDVGCWNYCYRTGKPDAETYDPETLEDLQCPVEAECRGRGKDLD